MQEGVTFEAVVELQRPRETLTLLFAPFSLIVGDFSSKVISAA